MQVRIAEGKVVIVIKEKSPGFYRGVVLEYFAMEPEMALTLAKDLALAGKELINERDNQQ